MFLFNILSCLLCNIQFMLDQCTGLYSCTIRHLEDGQVLGNEHIYCAVFMNGKQLNPNDCSAPQSNISCLVKYIL
jgi:hypothetical protein